MTENLQLTTPDRVTAQDIAEVIAELEQYRERLLNETLMTAQRAKQSKTKTLAKLEPQLADIDLKLQALREQHAMMETTH